MNFEHSQNTQNAQLWSQLSRICALMDKNGFHSIPNDGSKNHCAKNLPDSMNFSLFCSIV